jgi:hypothetical protein
MVLFEDNKSIKYCETCFIERQKKKEPLEKENEKAA